MRLFDIRVRIQEDVIHGLILHAVYVQVSTDTVRRYLQEGNECPFIVLGKGHVRRCGRPPFVIRDGPAVGYLAVLADGKQVYLAAGRRGDRQAGCSYGLFQQAIGVADVGIGADFVVSQVGVVDGVPVEYPAQPVERQREVTRHGEVTFIRGVYIVCRESIGYVDLLID